MEKENGRMKRREKVHEKRKHVVRLRKKGIKIKGPPRVLSYFQDRRVRCAV